MTRFIDRSNNNGTDDYGRAEITHIYLKASEGHTFTDATYEERRAQAHAAGAIVGAYHFAAHSDPVAEADHFLGIIGTPAPGHLRPCLDIESGQTAEWAEAFVKHCQDKLGYSPAIYGNTNTIPQLRAASAALRECPWWRAEFGPNDGNHHALSGGDMGAAAHQYTSVATLPGISGHTDASVFINEAALLVPTQTLPPALAAPKPDHWTITYHDVAGLPEVVDTKHPVLWQIRHRAARNQGNVVIHPVRHA